MSTPARATRPAPRADADARLSALYNAMRSAESRVGGGEGVEGLYGSITRTGMAKVVAALVAHAGLSPSSHLLDVGAGLGRPLLHALADPGVAAASGVEVDAVKVEKADAFARATATTLTTRNAAWALPALPDVQCAPIEAMPSLEPATHAYSFWEGVPPPARAAFGRLFARSRTLRAVAVVQRAVRGGADAPAAHLGSLGFGPLKLEASFPVSMSGSGRSFTAYVFVRAPSPLPRALAAAGGGRVVNEAAPPPPPSTARLPRARVAAAAVTATASTPPPPLCPRETRRHRRRAGLPAPPQPPLPDIRAFGRAARRAPAAAAVAAPLPPTPAPKAAPRPPTPAAKKVVVVDSPARSPLVARAGVAKAKGAAARRAARGLGAALVEAE